MAGESLMDKELEPKRSQVLAAQAQEIQKERAQLEADLDKIREQIGALDEKLNTVLGDVVACL